MKTTDRVKKMRDVSVDELRHQESDIKEQMFKLRFQWSMGQTETLNKLRQLRKAVTADACAKFAQARQFILIGELTAPLFLQEIHRTSKVFAMGGVVEDGTTTIFEVVIGMDGDSMAHTFPPSV